MLERCISHIKQNILFKACKKFYPQERKFKNSNIRKINNW